LPAAGLAVSLVLMPGAGGARDDDFFGKALVTGDCRYVGARHASPDEAPQARGRGMPRPYILKAPVTEALLFFDAFRLTT